MCKTCSLQGFLGSNSSSITSFPNSLPLHICNLREHRYNQFAHTFADCSKAKDFDGYIHFKKSANNSLNIKCVTPQTANIIYAKCIAFTNVFQQIRKAGTIFCKDSTGNAYIGELTFKVAPESNSLRLNGLVPSTTAIICDPAHWLSHLVQKICIITITVGIAMAVDCGDGAVISGIGFGAFFRILGMARHCPTSTSSLCLAMSALVLVAAGC